MADTGIFATTAEVQRKIGANASTTANAEAYINQFMTEAESYINSETMVNWSDLYSTLNVDVKGLLKEAASNLAAMYVLNYDLTGTSLRGFETRLDVLRDGLTRAMAALKVVAVQNFIKAA